MNIFTALGAGFAAAGATYSLIHFLENMAKNATENVAKYAYLFKISKSILDIDSKFLENYSDFYFNISNFSLKEARINNLDKDRFFYCYLKPDLKYYCTEIKLEGSLGKLARMIYAEASPGAENLKCKIAVGEVIRNRLYSNIYKRRKYKNYIDVIEDKTWNKEEQKYFYQFRAIDKVKYTNTTNNIKNPLEKEDFLIVIQAMLITHFSNSNITNGALSFHQSSVPPSSPYYKYKEHEINCKNKFFFVIS